MSKLFIIKVSLRIDRSTQKTSAKVQAGLAKGDLMLKNLQKICQTLDDRCAVKKCPIITFSNAKQLKISLRVILVLQSLTWDCSIDPKNVRESSPQQGKRLEKYVL